jgi:hypothetical protein
LGKLGRFLCADATWFTARNFCTAKAKRRQARSSAENEDLRRKEINMDYLVAIFTMLMIAGYACIVGRILYAGK